MKPPRGRLNRFIVGYIVAHPGACQWAVEGATREYGRSIKEYFCGGGYFFQRLDRMCRAGHLLKLIVGNAAHYFPAVDIPMQLLGKDRVVLQVAADYAEEELGNPLLADLLRKARRCVTKPLTGV